MSNYDIIPIPESTIDKFKLYLEEQRQDRELSKCQIEVLYSVLKERKNVFITGSAGKFLYLSISFY